MAVAREQPDTVAVTLDDQAIAVVLDLVDPAGRSGTLVLRVGRQGLKEDFSIPGKIGTLERESSGSRALETIVPVRHSI